MNRLSHKTILIILLCLPAAALAAQNTKAQHPAAKVPALNQSLQKEKNRPDPCSQENKELLEKVDALLEETAQKAAEAARKESKAELEKTIHSRNFWRKTALYETGIILAAVGILLLI